MPAYLEALKYIDNVVGALSAVGAYQLHRDESRLAKELAECLIETLKEADPDKMDSIDSEKLAELENAVETIVDVCEDIYGL